MEKKSLFVLALVTVFSFVFLTPQAQAGSQERCRWEGIAIGLGAAIVGSAILKAHIDSRNDRYVVVRHPPARVHQRVIHRPPPPPGRWEIQKEWVPPTYKRVWNPAHYDHRGKWVPGQWIEVVNHPGHWVEKKSGFVIDKSG